MAKEARSPNRTTRVFSLCMTEFHNVMREGIAIGWTMLNIEAAM